VAVNRVHYVPEFEWIERFGGKHSGALRSIGAWATVIAHVCHTTFFHVHCAVNMVEEERVALCDEESLQLSCTLRSISNRVSGTWRNSIAHQCHLSGPVGFKRLAHIHVSKAPDLGNSTLRLGLGVIVVQYKDFNKLEVEAMGKTGWGMSAGSVLGPGRVRMTGPCS